MGTSMFLVMFVAALLAPIIIIKAVYNHNLYKKIKRTGVAGFGRLISCKRIYPTSLSMIIPRYSPIIEFYYADKRYELSAIGYFGVQPGRVGEEIAIIFSVEHLDKVIIDKKKHVLDNFLLVFLLYLILCVVIIMLFTLYRSRLIT